MYMKPPSRLSADYFAHRGNGANRTRVRAFLRQYNMERPAPRDPWMIVVLKLHDNDLIGIVLVISGTLTPMSRKTHWKGTDDRVGSRRKAKSRSGDGYHPPTLPQPPVAEQLQGITPKRTFELAGENPRIEVIIRKRLDGSVTVFTQEEQGGCPLGIADRGIFQTSLDNATDDIAGTRKVQYIDQNNHGRIH